MKNISVIASLVSISSVLLLQIPLHAESNTAESNILAPYAFSFHIIGGFMYGQNEEIVYKYAGNEVYASQLLWDGKPLFYWGAGLELSLSRPLKAKGFFGDLTANFGIPSESGVMEDRDWIADNHDNLTHYSSHTNFTQGMLLFAVKTGVSIPLFSRCYIKIFLSFSYLEFKWQAEDGFFQYAEHGPWDPSIPKTDVSGPQIRYVQNWYNLSPGLSLVIPFFNFSFALSCGISPFIKGYAQDNHLSPNKPQQYNDDLRGGISQEFKGSFTFSPRRRFSAGLSLAWRSLRGARGASWHRYTGTNPPGPFIGSGGNSAGAGYSFWDTCLSFTVRL
ncbi:MAG: omptin family outer membrane protease [Treponema sp.]|jgi:outer membrane protease|nr:omptin family outer membrane protease [Treponema sp.]